MNLSLNLKKLFRKEKENWGKVRQGMMSHGVQDVCYVSCFKENIMNTGAIVKVVITVACGSAVGATVC